MSEVQAPVSQEREITIYATRGGQMKKITTAVTTWGELQPLVRREGFDLSSLLAAENINKSDLVNDLAVLPATAFRLFLRPKQTKSGLEPDRKECFAIIKAYLAVYPNDKSKFVIDGKNMTQLATPVVQGLVARYCKGTTAPAAPAVATPVKEKACVAKATSNEVPATDAEKVQQALKLIISLSNFESYDKCHKHLNRLLDEVSIPVQQEESEEEAARREAKEMGYL